MIMSFGKYLLLIVPVLVVTCGIEKFSLMITNTKNSNSSHSKIYGEIWEDNG